MPRMSFGWVIVLVFVVLPLACKKNDIPDVPSAIVPTHSESQPTDSNDERYLQTFAQAVTMDLGEDQQLPPDRTIAGQATAPLRLKVEQTWSSIKLTDDNGQIKNYVVTLDTVEGLIAISLRPDLAPNHVRNFLALVKAGYYDGLRFDRMVRQEGVLPDMTKVQIELLKAGCPAGTGDTGVGHIGYHLKPEFSDTKHEEGTVGMWHDLDPNTAGVRFYIALGPSPVLDGNFTIIGKVSKGMDIVKRISMGQLLPPDQDPTRELPLHPVVIKKATSTVIGAANEKSIVQQQ